MAIWLSAALLKLIEMEISLYILVSLSILVIFVFLYWKPRRKKKLQQEGLFFESSFGPIFYQVHGQGAPLLLIHGLGASSYCWRKLVPLLKKDFYVVNCDLWGFGKSHKDPKVVVTLDDHISILTELLDELKVEQVHIAGNSMGGHIALWFSKKFPDRVGKIIALSPAAHPDLVPDYTARIHWVSHWTPWLINSTFIKQLLIGVFEDPSIITKDVVEAYLEPYRDRKAHKTFASALKVIQDPRVYQSLESIDKEVLVLWGEKDRVIKRPTIEKIVRKLPYAHFETHPSSGHCAMEEHPEWCAEHIIPFLKSRPH